MSDSPNLPARPRVDEDPPPHKGVRIEYRTSVPRHLLGAAIAEAFGIIESETQQQDRPSAID
ncbi:hypothetical protein ACFXKY_15695 [Streptomyces canus]|uniref:hypothetical protein n=1 Tax=Streptomyces canus TaxID=58343 RepID=UPI003687535C